MANGVHVGEPPFEQALEYNIARPFSEKARWIVTCNFPEIWVYDMDHPLEDPQKLLLFALLTLFRKLDTPESGRDPYLA